LATGIRGGIPRTAPYFLIKLSTSPGRVEMFWITLIALHIILYGIFWLFVHALFRASEENDDITDRNV
jgi:hypothetical protein